MRSSLLDNAFSVLAFYKTAAGLRVKLQTDHPVDSSALDTSHPVVGKVTL